MSLQMRLFDCASIAGPYVDLEMGHKDAEAHYGLIHSTLDTFVEFARAIPGWQDLPVISLVVMIVERHGEELADRAAVMQWSKRKTAYDADCASWKAAEEEKGSNWRALPMTAAQRYLLADTARILEIEIPDGMSRGTAADWLDAYGANVIHKLEEDRA